MSTTITGNLFDLDTVDAIEYSRVPRDYNYTLKATGGGKLSFKIEHSSVPLGSSGGSWSTIEEKSKVESGHTQSGSFTAAASGSANSHLKFTFSRAALTKGVSYELYFSPA